MIATILPGSADFHAIGYNEHKVSKGLARLIEMRNFGTVGLADRPTTEELTGYLKKYSSAISKNTVPPTAASGNRSSMWPSAAKAVR